MTSASVSSFPPRTLLYAPRQPRSPPTTSVSASSPPNPNPGNPAPPAPATSLPHRRLGQVRSTLGARCPGAQQKRVLDDPVGVPVVYLPEPGCLRLLFTLDCTHAPRPMTSASASSFPQEPALHPPATSLPSRDLSLHIVSHNPILGSPAPCLRPTSHERRSHDSLEAHSG
jgi:hypothetical protein